MLVAQPVPPESQNLVRRPVVNPVREVDASDPVISQFPREREVITTRFELGAKCYVSEIKGNFAGYLWLAFDGYDEDEVRCRYEFGSAEPCAWDFDVYVDPAYRLGRTFARLWDAANVALLARGIGWSCSRISRFNPASVAAHKRLGMVRLHTATFLCVGTLQVSIISTKPFVHIGWSQKSRPVILLRAPKMLASDSP